MPYIPAPVRGFPLIDNGDQTIEQFLTRHEFVLLHRGKVRDTYSIPGSTDQLLVVATDRLSVFDVVTPFLVPGKGRILTAMTFFWLTQVLTDWPNHLVPSDINPDVSATYDLYKVYRQNFLLERCLVIKRCTMQPFELIFRRHLGGSVWDGEDGYVKTGKVAGYELPAGLIKWEQLPMALFTPSTKAEEGHDVNISVAEYLAAMGDVGQTTWDTLAAVYDRAYTFAAERGIRIFDTKFEFGEVLADEVLTPDSSRFVAEEDYQAMMTKGDEPKFFDKQVVRDELAKVDTPGGRGFRTLDTTNPVHQTWLDTECKVDESIIGVASMLYQSIFERLTGKPIATFQAEFMAVDA